MKLQLTGNSLKIIAMVTMFIDHFGMIFFPEVTLFRIIGRISFPIYAYLISEGCRYTKNRKRYFLQIFILGVICSIVYMLAERHIFFCVLITFSISILLIYLIDYVRQSFNSRIILLVISILVVKILCNYIEVDYGFFGILVPVMVYLTYDVHFKVILFTISLAVLTLMSDSSIQVYCLLSVPFILLYNGQRGTLNLKRFFYLFYPIHLALLWLINIIIVSFN